MNKELDLAQVREGIAGYCRAVHTQEAEDFVPLMAEGTENVLISPRNCFVGTEAILHDFLQGGIRKAYSQIDLIADSIDLRVAGEDTIVAVFAYHTECIRRDDGSQYGIAGLETQVWVRQHGAWKLTHVHYSA